MLSVTTHIPEAFVMSSVKLTAVEEESFENQRYIVLVYLVLWLNFESIDQCNNVFLSLFCRFSWVGHKTICFQAIGLFGAQRFATRLLCHFVFPI